jgi:hypothetical protein
MHSDRLTRPGKRTNRISVRPSRAGAEHPLGDYFIPPSDSLGRSVTISTSAAPEVRRLATILRETKVFPFETEQDVMRWCILHGLMKLEHLAKNKEVTSTRNALESWLKIAKAQMEMLYYAEKLSKVERVVELLIRGGHGIKAVALAEEVWRQSDRLEDPYWSKTYRERTKKALDRARKSMKRKDEGRGEREDGDE